MYENLPKVMVFTGASMKRKIAGREEAVGDCDSLRDRSDVEYFKQLGLF